MRPAWTALAACRGCAPALFFPERGEATEAARAVCQGCPVRPECLDYALARGEDFGIWGGLSTKERRLLRRRLRALDTLAGEDDRQPMPTDVDDSVLGDEHLELPKTNGHAVEGELRTCGLDGCDTKLTADQLRYCSQSHQKKAGWERRKEVGRVKPARPQLQAPAGAGPLWEALRQILDAGAEELTFRAGGLKISVSRADP